VGIGDGGYNKEEEKVVAPTKKLKMGEGSESIITEGKTLAKPVWKGGQ